MPSQNPFDVLGVDDELNPGPVSSNMRAKKNPNKGGDPHKQKKKDDKKAGHGSQPAHKGKSKKSASRDLLKEESIDVEEEEPTEDKPTETVEPVEVKETIAWDDYQASLEKDMAKNSLLAPKQSRAVKTSDQIVTKSDRWEDEDEEVPLKSKKGKKKASKKSLIEIETAGAGPTADPMVPLAPPRTGGSFFEKSDSGSFDRNRKGGDREGGRGRGRGRDNGEGGRGGGRSFNDRNGRGEGRGGRGRGDGGGGGRGGGRGDGKGGKGRGDGGGRGNNGGRDGGGRGREGGRGRGRSGVNIESKDAFPTLGN